MKRSLFLGFFLYIYRAFRIDITHISGGYLDLWTWLDSILELGQAYILIELESD